MKNEKQKQYKFDTPSLTYRNNLSNTGAPRLMYSASPMSFILMILSPLILILNIFSLLIPKEKETDGLTTEEQEQRDIRVKNEGFLQMYSNIVLEVYDRKCACCGSKNDIMVNPFDLTKSYVEVTPSAKIEVDATVICGRCLDSLKDGGPSSVARETRNKINKINLKLTEIISEEINKRRMGDK